MDFNALFSFAMFNLLAYNLMLIWIWKNKTKHWISSRSWKTL